MSILTTSQLTFCDLKDSYSIHIDTECIGLVCANDGSVSESQTVTIKYRVFAGQTCIGASCDVDDLPSGIKLISTTNSSNNADGSIELSITEGATLNNSDTSSMRLVFITLDDAAFTFERYVTFIKSMSGHDGIDAVDFQIYSVDGFQFDDNLQSITLNTAAFQAGINIDSSASYQWKYWSPSEHAYVTITGATSSSFVVNRSDEYSLFLLECEMTYDGITYTDYVSLTEKTTIYTSVVKFFDGSNIFTSNDLYIVAYVDLYKNNQRMESALDYAGTYCHGVSTVSADGVITSNAQGNFSDGNTMYFICKNGSNYDVILGKYTSGVWKQVIYECEYIYENSLNNIQSNIIVIPKESINKSRNIDFVVSYDGEEISRTSVNVIDTNDPIISNKTPDSPLHNQLWLDTSKTPNILKIYNQSEEKWLECADYSGSRIYTSKPTSYSKGDLWILADGITFGDYGPGSMLKATTTSGSFYDTHWVDADSSTTILKNNINQYFDFREGSGLKIGQKDEKFYVNIDSQEMGFYDNSSGQSNKVVSISNNAAKIKGLTVEDSAHFTCSATFDTEFKIGDVIFQKEENGSLSLA